MALYINKSLNCVLEICCAQRFRPSWGTQALSGLGMGGHKGMAPQKFQNPPLVFQFSIYVLLIPPRNFLKINIKFLEFYVYFTFGSSKIFKDLL